jgi:hypothetical protein
MYVSTVKTHCSKVHTTVCEGQDFNERNNNTETD